MTLPGNGENALAGHRRRSSAATNTPKTAFRRPSTGHHDIAGLADPVFAGVQLDLHRQVARIVRQMPSSEIHAKFPNLGKRALTDLRNEKPGFGWDRLNTCAVRLGIDVAAIWAKHYTAFRAKSKGDVEKTEAAVAAANARVDKLEAEIGTTKERITGVEKSIIELGAKAVTREDLKELKQELSDAIAHVAERMEKAVESVRSDLRAAKPGSRSSPARSKVAGSEGVELPRIGKVGKVELAMNGQGLLRPRTAAPAERHEDPAPDPVHEERQGFCWPGQPEPTQYSASSRTKPEPARGSRSSTMKSSPAWSGSITTTPQPAAGWRRGRRTPGDTGR